MFTVEFYETEDGERPVRDFIAALDPKMRAKVVGSLRILAEKGNQLREPDTKPLGDGIFELRSIFGSNIARALFFFYVGKKIIVTNGFIKKRQKTPKNEIELAKKRRADYLQRQEKEKGEKK